MRMQKRVMQKTQMRRMARSSMRRKRRLKRKGWMNKAFLKIQCRGTMALKSVPSPGWRL